MRQFLCVGGGGGLILYSTVCVHSLWLVEGYSTVCWWVPLESISVRSCTNYHAHHHLTQPRSSSGWLWLALAASGGLALKHVAWANYILYRLLLCQIASAGSLSSVRPGDPHNLEHGEKLLFWWGGVSGSAYLDSSLILLCVIPFPRWSEEEDLV